MAGPARRLAGVHGSGGGVNGAFNLVGRRKRRQAGACVD
jgi:hypothetical protein